MFKIYVKTYSIIWEGSRLKETNPSGNFIGDTLSSRLNPEKFFSAYSVMAFASFSASSIPSSPIASGVVQKGKIKLPFVNILP